LNDLWANLAETVPDPLGCLEGLKRLWPRLGEDQRDRLKHSKDAFHRLGVFLSASPALTPFLLRHPDLVSELFLDGRLESPGVPLDVREEFLERCVEAPEALPTTLARFRNSNLVRLYAQEVLELRPLQEIWRDWSQVASVCIEGALRGCRRTLPQEGAGVVLAVIGMGKLGGEELNFASDIDLFYLYDHDRAVDPQLAHAAAAQWAARTTRVLETASEEGPAFRVDLNLRPGGKDGDVVQTLEAAELYYQSQAVTWERLALIKARPVAGDTWLGDAFVRMVRPFVYRRYLDYGSLEEIRTLKERIRREVLWRRSRSVDVKLGRGGIREVEFFIQALQLVYGGKYHSLRRISTLVALAALAEEGLVERDMETSLREAYLFLRRVEHRVQMVLHRQTHSVPLNERERIRLARLMGYEGKEAVERFQEDLLGHMERVHQIFAGLLGPRRVFMEQLSLSDGILASLEGDEEAALGRIRDAGFQQPRAVLETLRRLTGSRSPARRSPRAMSILQRLMPVALKRIMECPRPDQTLFRLERFLEAVGPRGGYYALLEENPKVLERLVELFGRSALLSRWMAQHLEAIDALIDRGHHRARKGKEDLILEMEGMWEGVEETEERLGRLRAFRAQEVLRIGVADLWGELDPVAVGEELTALAEACMEMTLRECMRASGWDRDREATSLCVLGLGSLGGWELSYRSDLDLLFVVQGDEGIPVLEELTRLGQRFISWLSVPMKEGPGWSVDLRLRPSGSRGPLMASVESLRRYYEREASPWERQVLLKARPCAGDPFLGRRVLEEFSEVLCGSSPPSRDELLAMRLRIERERAEVGREGELHLKLGPGGMMDIEFLVQYLQMECWAVCSGVRTTRTLDVIRSLTESGRLPRQEGEALFRAYTVLKGLENRLGLILDHRGTDEPCSIQDLEALEPLEDLPWVPTRLRKGGLVQGLRHLLDEVRSIFLRHMEGGASSLR